MRLTFSVLLLLFILPFSYAKAENWDWRHYSSETALYKVELPAEPEVTYNRMRISNDRVLEFEHMSLEVPLDVEDGSSIQFHTRFIQTWGVGEKYGKREDFIFSYVKQFLFYYENIGGKILKDADIRQGSFYGRELIIHLPPKEGKELAVHARIFFETQSIIHQIMIAPVQHIDNAAALRYIYSLDLLLSEKNEPGDISQEWNEIALNREGTISILLPGMAPPYMGEPPKVERNDNLLRVSALFYDPFQNEHLLFRAYIYDFTGRNISKLAFREFVVANHDVPKGRRNWESIAIGDMIGLKYTAEIESSGALRGQEYKNMKAWFARNYYDRDYIVVIETSGSRETLFTSDFENFLFGSLNFERDARAEAAKSGQDVNF